MRFSSSSHSHRATWRRADDGGAPLRAEANSPASEKVHTEGDGLCQRCERTIDEFITAHDGQDSVKVAAAPWL